MVITEFPQYILGYLCHGQDGPIMMYMHIIVQHVRFSTYAAAHSQMPYPNLTLLALGAAY